MHIPSYHSFKVNAKSGKLSDHISRQRKIFYLTKTIWLIMAAGCLCLLFSSCAQSQKPFGIYYSKPFTVEFAYSKTFLTNEDLPVNTEKEDKNANMIEGWYTMEEDKIICRYTQTKDDVSLKYDITFLYDKDQDSLTLIETHLPDQTSEKDTIWPIDDAQGVYQKTK